LTEFTPHLKRLFAGLPLTSAQARQSMDAILSGALEPVEVAAFLGAVAARGLDAEELAGLALGMRARGVGLELGDIDAIDTAGTGGDGLSTFNFSTAAAFVAAGAGAYVAKHGNVSSTSKCGSADVLQALGVPLNLPPDAALESLRAHRFAFLFAPQYHPALKHVMPIRRALRVRTVFNLLGPLCNPAGVRRQVAGVYSSELVDIYGAVLERLGAKRGLVVHGADDGMDEVSLTGPTRMCFVEEGRGLWVETVYPEDLGLQRADLTALGGGEPAHNAALLRDVLRGRGGPLVDGTLLNAAAALWVSGLASTLREGVALARDAVQKGLAIGVLEAVAAQGSALEPA
jgi:anthranilate phosphoribosyltransferase